MSITQIAQREGKTRANETAPVARGGVETKNTAHGFCNADTTSVKPVFPDMDFLPGRVLGILLTGRRYTSKDAWIELCHSRCSDSIWKLRRLGWPVQMVEEVVATGDAGRPASIGVYFLTPESIADAGEPGQKYAAECARIEAERRAA